MKRLFLLMVLLLSLTREAAALELEPPEVPPAGQALMPEDTSSFSGGFLQLLQKALAALRPDIREAGRIGAGVLCTGLVLSVVQSFSGSPKGFVTTAGVLGAASLLLNGTDTLIHLASDTIQDLSEYGKLLLPVMTAALAAQGGTTASAALYAGTAAFDLILSTLISRCLVPLIYGFLALAVASAAAKAELLKKLRDLIKQLVSWTLKTLLTVFTTYMSITGVISGTTDQVALKAAKMTISTVVPVVGGILSDASETVLVSAGLVKNAAGIYGILALCAVFLAPFLTIGVHYLLMKLTAALCGLLECKSLTDLTEDVATAMGLLLAMTGSVCLLQLVSTICFLKGIQ